MDAATVFKLLSLIPDRSAAALGGSSSSSAALCKHPERLAFLAQRAHWLAPLDTISREEQRMLGLLSPHVRPANEEADFELDETLVPSCVEEEPASVAAL